jgi:hypothetical protein
MLAVHEQGLMNLLWLATLVGGETSTVLRKSHGNRENPVPEVAHVHPSPTWARPYPVLPLHPYLYTPWSPSCTLKSMVMKLPFKKSMRMML